MTVAPPSTPARPPRLRPVTTRSRFSSLPTWSGAGLPAAEPPVQGQTLPSTSSRSGQDSVLFSPEPRELPPISAAGAHQGQAVSPGPRAAEAGTVRTSTRARQLRTAAQSLFGPLPYARSSPVEETASTVAADRSQPNQQRNETPRRDSFVRRIAQGLAGKRSVDADPVSPSSTTRTPLPLSPTMNGPALELSPPSIRSPAALPAPSSPFSASETGAEPAASLRGGPATPPRAGVDRRDDTPIPSPRPGTTTDDPPATYQRPRAFRTLQWSFLPSRSARVVANRHPLVDRELNDEERQWVEVSGKVPDDGTTRDRWDNPIGTGGDWGRTVLSPIVTETETSSSSRPHPQHSSWSSTRSAHPSAQLPLDDLAFTARASALGEPGATRVDVALPHGDGLVSPPLVPLPGTRPAAPPRGETRTSSRTPQPARATPSSPLASVTRTHRTASRASASTSNVSARTATPAASSVTKLGNRSPWLTDDATTTRTATQTVSDDGYRFSTPPTSPTTAADYSSPSGPRMPRRPTDHDYHSLSTIETLRVAEPARPPLTPSRPLTSSLAVGAGREKRKVDDSIVRESVPTESERQRTRTTMAPSLVGSSFAPRRHPVASSTEKSASTTVKSEHGPPRSSLTEKKADSIARWRAAVVPSSTAEHAPDPSKNGFRSRSEASNASPAFRLSGSYIQQDSVTKAGTPPASRHRMTTSSRIPRPYVASRPASVSQAEDDDADSSECFSLPFSPPPSRSPPRTGEPSALEAAGDVSPSFYDDEDLAFELTTREGQPADASEAWSYQDVYDRFEQRYPPPSPLQPLEALTPIGEVLHASAPSTLAGPTAASSQIPQQAPPESKSRRPFETGSSRPSRLGAYPMPELTAEERAARRALRKSGRSPEHHLPLHATKAELRKQAWLERQAFEAERDRLLRLLSSNEHAEPADNPLEQLQTQDIPVLNRLSELHFGTTIPATHEAGLYYLQLSLRLDEAQPEKAHKLALLLEERDLEEAVHWHQAAVRHAPDDPEYLLYLSNAYRTIGNVDSAAHAFGELTQRFRNTPYEALGWYKLARLFEDHTGTPEELSEAHQSFAAAYECLEWLSQVPPQDRQEGPWSTLGQVEEGTLFGLALFGEELRHLPRLFPSEISVGSGRHVTEGGDATTWPEAPSTLFDSPDRLDSPGSAPDHRIALSSVPSFPPPSPVPSSASLPAAASPAQRTHKPTRLCSVSVSEPSSPDRTLLHPRRHRPLRTNGPPLESKPAGPRTRRKVDPVVSRTLDTAVKGLRLMSHSQDAADLAASTRELADQVETTFGRLYEARRREAAGHDELFRALEQVHRELVTLPDRVASSPKLSASRPPGVEPISPSLDPVESALRRVERARLLSA